MDRSLKSASSLTRHRNVLTRGERMNRLTEQDKFPAGRSILGLPKVANRKMSIGKTPKAEVTDATAAPAAKGAKGAKGAAAPAAKGAKGAAAPAAKGAKGAAAPAAKGAPAAKKK
jgi:small basic protein (TIGR04137 family)